MQTLNEKIFDVNFEKLKKMEKYQKFYFPDEGVSYSEFINNFDEV